MKLSLFPLLLSTALFACSSDPAPDAPPNVAAPTATTDPPTAAPPTRKLVTKPLAATPAENLLVDPEFQSLWAPIDETGFGIYESFVQDGSYAVRFEPRTPKGAGLSVLSVDPSAAGATLSMTVIGGKGPLAVRVWVAAPKGKEPSIELASLYDDTAVTLAPDEATRTKIDDVEWVEMTGTSAGDMPGMLYFVATVNEPARFHAPRVTSAALPPKNALPSHALVTARPSMHAPSSRAVNAARAAERLRSRYVTMSPPPAPARPPPARLVE
jgi:hypothetical protein